MVGSSSEESTPAMEKVVGSSPTPPPKSHLTRHKAKINRKGNKQCILKDLSQLTT